MSSTYMSARPRSRAFSSCMIALVTTWKHAGVPVHPKIPHRKNMTRSSVSSMPSSGTSVELNESNV